MAPEKTGMRTLCAALAQRLPCYYGWLIFALVASTSYAARPLMSVSVLAVFMVPITETFGWSRGVFSGAVSLGGLGGVLIAPRVGRVLDKYGAGVVMSLTSAIAGLCAVGLAQITQVWTFYACYIPGRMVFASPLELATTTSLSNWFLRRRALVLALYGMTQGTGLAAMPLVAQWLIMHGGWQHAWMRLGLYTLAVGVVPPGLLMVRRPEDLGLASDVLASPDRPPLPVSSLSVPTSLRAVSSRAEPHFTLRQALRTRAFWALALFAALGFMAQAGVSLHQVSHYIHQGFSASMAAMMASLFAVAQVPAGLGWSALTRRVPLRGVLALAGLSVALGVAGMTLTATSVGGGLASAVFGAGVAGLHLLMRLAWAEYYGRQHLGTIQGVTLPVQLLGQALGPVLSGVLFDRTGSYEHAFLGLAGGVLLGSLLVLSAVPPHQPDRP